MNLYEITKTVLEYMLPNTLADRYRARCLAAAMFAKHLRELSH